ncbi:MAG: NAD(P)H-dependent oxidoreductase [Verrucomicrobiales bacterium]|nr:NAD(P)H-dependent oxidoreductase [Verrucomicrobiales bacterium]
MNTLSPSQLLEALQWRYATKVFDPQKKIPAATWEALSQSLVLSPSSYGLQPYRILVVGNATTRQQLLPHSWGQRQVVDASHLLVFAARTSMTEAEIDAFVNRIAEVRGIAISALADYRGMMIGDVVQGPRSAVAGEWAARQAYIALGNLLTSAALLGVDACPMEGLIPQEYDKVLGLSGTGYVTVVAATLGYRMAADKYASLPKVRFPVSHLIKSV